MKLFSKATLSCLMLVPALLAAQTFTGDPDPNIDIIDEGCFSPQTHIITVAGVGTIDYSNGLESVCINFTHTYVGDLYVYLIAPDGTTVELTTNNGGSGDNYTNTCFDMSATTAITSITSADAPFTGSYRPEGSLATVNNGQDANGNWTLRICDDEGGATGTFDSWSITFGNNPAPPPPANNDCANAQLLSVGDDATCTTTAGTNLDATNSGETPAPAPSCARYNGGDVWYKVEVPPSGNVSVDVLTSGSGPTDMAMEIYSGTCGGSLMQIECDDDDGTGGNQPFIALTGQAVGATLYIRVWEYGNDKFGPFNICAHQSATTLPVELTDFSVSASLTGVQLNWSTASETENLGFVLERRVGAADFTEIASYKTEDALLGQGSVEYATDYEYVDSFVKAGQTYEYRLADVDYAGTVTYHAARSVTVTTAPLDAKVEHFTVLAAYPNPFNPSTTLRYALPAVESNYTTTVQIYDLTGKLVKTLLSEQQSAGWHSVVWHGTDNANNQVPAGVYLSKVSFGGETKTIKVMLLK